MFYDYFDELCNRKGVSPNKACTDMGISRSVAAKWKSTDTKPRMETIIKIANYFGVSADEILMFGCGIDNSDVKPYKAREEFKITVKEEQLIKAFRMLNLDGQDIMLDYAIMLTKNEKYVRFEKDIHLSVG